MICDLEHRIFEGTIRLSIGENIIVLHSRELHLIYIYTRETGHDDEKDTDRSECYEDGKSLS